MLMSSILVLLSIVWIPVSAAQECVVLLHGLGRSALSMNAIERALVSADFKVVSVDYPSTQFSIEELSVDTMPSAISACGDHTIHFVTHSMGGILVRHHLASHELSHLGHVVMLGPPNQGSEVVDALREVPGYYALNGPAGQELGTDADSVPLNLGPATYSVGIIAGSQTVNPVLSKLIPGIDDGKVSIERTKLEGMTDHLVLPVTHTFMMRNPEVIEQVLHYLRTGQFDT